MRMHAVIGVVGFALVLARPAAADDAAARRKAIKAMLAAQTAAILADDKAAFDATLAKDAIVSIDLDKPDASYILGNFTVGFLKKITVARSQIGWAGTWGWVAAELKVTSKLQAEPEGAGNPHPRATTEIYHWVALVVADGDGVKTRALRATPAKADKDLVGNNYVQELTPIASPSPLVALLAQPSALAKQLATDAATTVLGSAPRDGGFGAAAAKKLVGKWTKLTLEVVESPEADQKERYQPIELAVGDAAVVWAKVRMKVGARWVLLEVFAIARKVGSAWELVALEYGPG